MSPRILFPKRTPCLREIILLCLIGASAAAAFTILKNGSGELEVYCRAAQRFATGEEIYRLNERGPFTYPPFFVVPFVPLATLPVDTARAAFYFANVLMLGAIVFLIIQTLPKPKQPDEATAQLGPESRQKRSAATATPHWKLFLVVAVLAGRYAISPLEYQAHDLIVFLLVTAAIVTWDAKQQWWPGFWVGLAAACKATPLLFLPVLLWQRKLTSATTLLITLIAATLLPDAISSRAGGRMWASSWFEKFVSKVDVGVAPHVDSTWRSWSILNQSLAGTLYRLSSPKADADSAGNDVSMVAFSNDERRAATIASIVLVLGFVAFVTRPSLGRELNSAELSFLRLSQGAVVVCAMLLLSPVSSKQHFCVLLLPIFVLCVDFFCRNRSVLLCSSMLVILICGTLVAKDVVGRPIGNHFLSYGSLTICAITCMLATGYVTITYAKERSAKSREQEAAAASVPLRVAETRIAHGAVELADSSRTESTSSAFDRSSGSGRNMITAR